MPCHGPQQLQSGLNLSSPAGIAALFDHPSSCGLSTKPLIAPGDPDGSYLFEKVSSANPPCGGRMPPNGVALSPAEIMTLREYISSLGTDGSATGDASSMD
jgi:hypothetical protein